MLDTLRAHREALENMLVTARYTPAEPVAPALRITLGIYAQILSDGISTLGTIIAYLEGTTDGNTA